MSKKVKYNDKPACWTSTETWATSPAHEKRASWMNCVCAKVAQRRKLKPSYSVFEITNESGCWFIHSRFFIGKRRFNIKLWKTFTDCFNCLPIAAIVDEKIFCCHGGGVINLLFRRDLLIKMLWEIWVCREIHSN